MPKNKLHIPKVRVLPKYISTENIFKELRVTLLQLTAKKSFEFLLLRRFFPFFIQKKVRAQQPRKGNMLRLASLWLV